MNLELYKSQLTIPLQDATLCYLIKEDQILFAEKLRGFGIGILNGAGGKRITGETIEEALTREVEEEINVLLKKFTHVATLYFYFPENPKDINTNQTVFVYLATEWQGEPSESDEMRPSWYDRSPIPLDKMWDADKLWLPFVLTGKKVIAEFVYNSNNQLIENHVQVVDTLGENG